MREYPKIYGPYLRHTEGPDRNKLIEGAWSRPEIGYLADFEWHFTEKVDGTNIRVHWDGHKVEFGGRTERAPTCTPSCSACSPRSCSSSTSARTS